MFSCMILDAQTGCWGPLPKVRHWDCAPLDQPDPIHQPDPLYQPGPEFKIASSSVDADERADVVFQADVVEGEVLMHGTGEELLDMCYSVAIRSLAWISCLNPNISWTVFGTQFWISLFQVFPSFSRFFIHVHTCPLPGDAAASLSRQDDPSAGLLMGIPGPCRNGFILKQVPNSMVCHGLSMVFEWDL